MKLLKMIICEIVGHKLEKPSIIKTINPDHWLRECSRCGLYLMHGEKLGCICMTKRGAYKIKREFEEEFPYAK